jgi:hypothetical protein
MPMHWRRIAWFVSFAIALVLALWMRSLGYDWSATLGVAVVVWIVLPFVISQLCAAFILVHMHRRIRRTDVDGLAEKIAQAVKGLPPEEQEAVGKRMIDESLNKAQFKRRV